MSKYARVATAMGVRQANDFLLAGWEVITAAFCQLNMQAAGGPAVSYVPHILMGLPSEIAEKARAQQIRDNVWAAPQTPEASPIVQPEAVEAPKAPEPAPSPQVPIGTRRQAQAQPAGDASSLFSPPDLGKSEEVMIGVRRR